MAELKCCPFCGSHKVIVCRTNPFACWVRCDACFAEAPSHRTRRGAFKNWNRRHYDDIPADIVQDDDIPEDIVQDDEEELK
jgi:hypothetical protein